MVDGPKYHPVPNNNIISTNRDQFSLFRASKSSIFFYGVASIFIGFTVFAAFSPVSSSSNWFIDILTKNQHSSVFSYFYSDSSQTHQISPSYQLPTSQNSTNSQISPQRSENFEPNCLDETCNGEKQSNENIDFSQNSQSNTTNEQIPISDNALESATSVEESNNGEDEKVRKEGEDENDVIGSLVDCDLYDGEWVRDDSYPLYEPGSCWLVDNQFSCFKNGRFDRDYLKYKWKPKGCTLPRLNADHMIELFKGKRIAFIGDSLNRNMWESLICLLRNSVQNKDNVYEAFGRKIFHGAVHFSFVFKDYNFTLEFFVSPFLVQPSQVKNDRGRSKNTLRLDLFVRTNEKFKDADFLVFNTGHWWNRDKTSNGEGYFQEGDHVYQQLDLIDAFQKAMTTWGRWIDTNVNPNKTHVLFRGYSVPHFRGGPWNSGGKCDNNKEPTKNETELEPYPQKMKVLESVIKQMNTHVTYLNISRLTDYRKDAHPSIYRSRNPAPDAVQDCSHWCLPGVPDSWNELLFAELLRMQYKNKKNA